MKRLVLFFPALVLVQGLQPGLGGRAVETARADEAAGINAGSTEAQRVALGKKLFFDARLSAGGTISCARCHRPELAFTDGLPVARGVAGRLGTRNTPSVLNVGVAKSLFWDGRRSVLEEQVTDPFFNAVEHDLPDVPALLTRLDENTELRAELVHAFGLADSEAVTLTHVAQALASYLRTLRSHDSPFDRYFFQNQRDALSAEAVRGLELFRGRAQCASCHVVDEEAALFTDQDFHSLGVGMQGIEARLPELAKRVHGLDARGLDRAVLADPDLATLGRFLVTKRPADIGKFKTPSLRNVAVTGPYMHDGSVATLAAALERELYYRGLASGAPLALTADEKSALLAFLNTLTDREYSGAQAR